MPPPDTLLRARMALRGRPLESVHAYWSPVRPLLPATPAVIAKGVTAAQGHDKVNSSNKNTRRITEIPLSPLDAAGLLRLGRNRRDNHVTSSHRCLALVGRRHPVKLILQMQSLLLQTF